MSEDDAEALLLYDLIAIGHALNEAVFTPLTQNQFDALASFAFNLGLDNFHRSGVLRRLNEARPSRRRARWSSGARPRWAASGSSSTPWSAAGPAKRPCS